MISRDKRKYRLNDRHVSESKQKNKKNIKGSKIKNLKLKYEIIEIFKIHHMSFTEDWRWEKKVSINLKQINRDYPI